MDLVQLRSFVEVAHRGTVAAAASAQGYTAPAISQHLAKLSAELGSALFDRVGGRLTLTAAGAALLPIAHELLDLEARGRAAVTAPSAVPHVVVAGFASAIATVLLPRLGALRERAEVELWEAEDAEALRELGLGSVDIVLTQEYDGAPTEHSRRFTYTPVVRDRLRLVLPPAMPADTALSALGSTAWLLNGRSTRCADATRRILASAGLAPPIAGAIADNATLLGMVAAGHGVTVLPERVLDDAAVAVTVAHQDLGIGRTIDAVTRTATAPVLAPLVELLVR